MSVHLFIPCFIEHLRPRVGLATVEILERLGIEWTCPDKQTCCGQPAHNAGYTEATLPAARHFLSLFGGAERIVAPSASCTAMVRRYHELDGLETDERERLLSLAERCFELSDFLVNQVGKVDLGASFKARAAFQDGCHALRELGLVDEPRQLLRAVKDLQLVEQDGLDCCGFGGLYSVRMPELSAAQADSRLDALRAADCGALIATDSSCLLHIEARAAKRGLTVQTWHLAEVLAGAQP